ncbi:hypothetical protein ABDK56_12725 [Sphingomonas sp. ASV193]|uniref:hypothetical protein n=1 Tax=Sphingomonas sp. ASV193 TaxID=3144405 RepID=UPI0032E8DBB4
MSEDQKYYSDRADEHRQSSADAASEHIAEIHDELAARYEALRAELDKAAPTLKLVSPRKA